MIAALAALLVLYATGYVTGALLIPPSGQRISPALGIVRLVTGLFVTATGYLLSVAVRAPWAVGPLVALLLALALHRQRALTLPAWPQWTGWSDASALLLAAILIAPPMIALMFMAPGTYPPVFYNVDTPYFLEKVHALLQTDRLPPPSLGVLGGLFPYHYGVPGIAAVISRTTGLLPHQATFAVALPLLLIGSVAAAFVAAGTISPAIPRVLSVPMLLILSPTLWRPFWQRAIMAATDATRAGSTQPFHDIARDYETWGVSALAGQNLGAQFITLAVIGGIAGAATRGWTLPVFLVGCAVLFKAPTGIALIGGFVLMLAWAGLRSRTVRPLGALAAVIALFGVVYSALWILPGLPKSYATELYPLFHTRWLADGGRLPGFLLDLTWLAAPALLVLGNRRSGADQPAHDALPAWLAIMAIAPLLIVNTLRGVDLRPGRGIDYDWFQMLMTVPIVAHACVLAIAGRAWPSLSHLRRALVAAAIVLAVAGQVGVAANYAVTLVTHPADGHEYTDNHAIAAALQAIPTSGSVIVTNDLRYPADTYSRDYRQLQIPSLFGHQAFDVNYVYEAYDFSRDRLALQKLLQADQWTPEIDVAARRYGWTHLLVRKDFVHPTAIPLTRIFENEEYAVYRFPTPPFETSDRR